MPAAITDKFNETTNGSRPVPTTLTVQKNIAATQITVGSTGGWPVNTAVHFIIYKKDANGAKIAGTQIDVKGIVLDDTTITGIQIKAGVDDVFPIGSAVIAAPTAAWADDVVEGISVHANQDGSLKTAAVQAALNTGGSNVGGWETLATAPVHVTNNGNRSADIRFDNVNYTDRLSKGMRLRIPRTGTAVQTQNTKLNGTNHYWQDTTVSGMAFTDDFTAGAWIKVDKYQQGTIIGRRNAAATGGWALYIDSGGRLIMTGWNTGGGFRFVGTRSSVPLSKTTHVVATLDMSAGVGTIYLDGISVPVEVAGAATSLTQVAEPLTVGAVSSTPVDFFTGEVAQAFVATSVLTQTAVRNIMNTPITMAVATANNIISAYAFDGNGNDLNTTNANNLSAINGVTATNVGSPFNANAYAIIMSDPVFTSGNTTMTISTAEGYPIPNTTLGTTSYSYVKTPYGFPTQKSKWRLEVFVAYGGISVNLVTNGVWVAIPLSLTLPAGEWDSFGYKGTFNATTTGSNSRSQFYVLSSTVPTTSVTSMPLLGRNHIGPVTQNNLEYIYVEGSASVTTPTTYTMYASSDVVTGTETASLRGDQGLIQIFADNALL